MNSIRRERKVAASNRDNNEAGVVLLLVLWVLALMSLLILSWTQESRTEVNLTENYREEHQCRRLAEAGIFYAIGKLVENKINEEAQVSQGVSPGAPPPAAGWAPDQSLHELQLTTGRVQIRIADEGGKINLNQADDKTLSRLLAAVGMPEEQVSSMVEAIIDWRTKGTSVARPVKSTEGYYRNLDPPYSLKADQFDLVEELAWVRGFIGSPLLPHLLSCLTVEPTGNQINVNTAPREVLQALGLTADQAEAVVALRQDQPLRQFNELPNFSINPMAGGGLQNVSFRSSPFFTILATGVVNNMGARHNVKAVVRLDVNSPKPWQILSWEDDYPL